MGRLVEPQPRFENGTPAGKAILWVGDTNGAQLTEYLVYDSVKEAILDAAQQMFEVNGAKVVINYKTPDESYLDIWVLEQKAHWPKHNKSIIDSICNWWSKK
jgi:hypothetical protein